MAKFKVTGEKRLKANLKKLAVKATAASAAALFQEGEQIMAVSKASFVPIDDDILRASGEVKKPVITPKGASVTLGYGGAAEAYALAVHEHPSEHSPPSWSGGVTFKRGGPKYLEKPIRNAEAGINARLGVKIAVSFRKII